MPHRPANQNEDIGQLAKKLTKLLMDYWYLTPADRDRLVNMYSDELTDLYVALDPLL